ncbi:MAG: Rpn family recombination-promoting nuclease/putative transposase, partial [Planctomycetaceae bacterium]|nr:Rpn family recombination-promoting nuclease/putative transposase [Planctomycetaceae bacterium]
MTKDKYTKLSVEFELSHPHDLLARYFLLDTELFAELLKNYDNTGVVDFIDLNSLDSHSPITIDENLKEVIGDLLFSAKFKNGKPSKIFLFFEHQSKKKARFWISTLRKLMEFYEQYDADPTNAIGKGGTYPYPIVVLLYHGNIPWEELLQLRDLLSLPPGVDRNVLWFPIILIDLSRTNQKNLQGHPALLALLDTFISQSKGTLSEGMDRIFGYFKNVKKDRRTHGWVNSLTRYFASITKVGVDALKGTVAKIIGKKGAEKMVMSTMEELYTEGK